MINIIDKLLEDWKKQNDISGLVVNDNGFIDFAKSKDKDPRAINIAKSFVSGLSAEKLASDKLKLESLQKKWEKRYLKYQIGVEKYYDFSSIENEELESIHIILTWKKTRIYGYCPDGEMIAKAKSGKTFKVTGAARCCGVDKVSTCIASMLNECKITFRELVRYYEKHAQSMKDEPHKVIGYGSGYSDPYFEGGVGMESIIPILNTLGFKLESEIHGMHDCWFFRKR